MNNEVSGSERLTHDEARQRVLQAVGRLSRQTSEADLVMALRSVIRTLVSCDAAAVIRREGDTVRYVAEDAGFPLMLDKPLAIAECISGQALLRNTPMLLADVSTDPRMQGVPHTNRFVQSLAIFPVGQRDPQWAIGAYWRHPGPIDRRTVTTLASLARAAGQTFERLAATARAG